LHGLTAERSRAASCFAAVRLNCVAGDKAAKRDWIAAAQAASMKVEGLVRN